MPAKKRIAILTGGGDCPGLNAVIRAIARKSFSYGYEVLGIKNGWKGLVGNDTVILDDLAVSGILHKGGTILGTSRFNPYKEEKNIGRLKANFKKLRLSGLIVIGGEDTLGVANKLYLQEHIPIVGIPKTIDNDLSATDFTFGFDTAVNIATECIGRLHTTAESHHRIIVTEVMGRHAGWIATYAGIAGGADIILIPEIPIDMQEVVRNLKARQKRGKTFSIVVVAEGAKFKKGEEVLQEEKLDAFGHVRLGGIGQALAERIEKITGFETRVVVLGHIQRGGTPTAMDRVLSTRYGVKAAELVHQKKFGFMVALHGTEIKFVKLQEAIAEIKTVNMELYNIAKVFFG